MVFKCFRAALEAVHSNAGEQIKDLQDAFAEIKEDVLEEPAELSSRGTSGSEKGTHYDSETNTFDSETNKTASCLGWAQCTHF